jgi:hypothetical protein
MREQPLWGAVFMREQSMGEQSLWWAAFMGDQSLWGADFMGEQSLRILHKTGFGWRTCQSKRTRATDRPRILSGGFIRVLKLISM